MPVGVYERVKKRGGWKLSALTRKNMSAAMKGNKHSKGLKNTLGKHWKVKNTSNISKARMGNTNGFQKGEKNRGWKGGVTPINEKIRKSIEYKLWRTAVFERDRYTCRFCGAKNGTGKTVILNADHIKPFSMFPELRFAIDNGRTLCVECHKKTDTYGRKIINYKNNI